MRPMYEIMNQLVAIQMTYVVRVGSYIGHCHIDLESLLCEFCIFDIVLHLCQ